MECFFTLSIINSDSSNWVKNLSKGKGISPSLYIERMLIPGLRTTITMVKFLELILVLVSNTALSSVSLHDSNYI